MFQLVKCIYQSVQTQYGYNLSGPFLQNLEEESIWPMLAIESLKALGGPGLLSLGGKYLLRCIFEVGIIFLIITQSRCLVGIFEFGTVFLLHLCRKKTLSFQLIEKKLKRRWRLCVKSLQGNRLTGKIPEVIGLMQALAVLNFSSNNFKGRIPVELGRIINLDTLKSSLRKVEGAWMRSWSNISQCLKRRSWPWPNNLLMLSIQKRVEKQERELQEAWGGLSLGNSIRPHLSKLEREKAAWKRAEEEEQTRARG
ncbi:MDIS1-interacting receptor like kinase 1-like isoform X2 [Magnolia sinica]|uniref:MDIS1-interacting receptor like kinase 1-like isoform X2 n=1 Tax=Magnolia sinica TaxID=86752 RepID=UPI00265AAE20|nr:MDIS1-interacting receptor like kinase 1-like isoform X2 [Magnolia sinica]